MEAVNDHGAGALHPAASSQNLEVCEYLVEDVGVNVDAVDEAGLSLLDLSAILRNQIKMSGEDVPSLHRNV